MKKLVKILLVGTGKYLSLFGLRILSAVLNEKGFNTSICFLPVDPGLALFNDEIEILLDFIQDYDPDLVGFSMMYCDALRVQRITRLLKSRSQIPVIWGGLHPTVSPETIPEFVDFICVGEGEIPLSTLAEEMQNNNQNVSRIPGIWSRNSVGEWDQNEPKHRIQDLDALPFPDYSLNRHFVLYRKQIRVLDEQMMRKHLPHLASVHPLITTRGCPQLCSFCANSALIKLGEGPYVRRRTPRRVIEEMNHILTIFPYIMGFIIADDLFVSASEEWLETFCQSYKQTIDLPFYCEIHPSYVQPGIMPMLEDAGLRGIGMGVQSFSDRINTHVFNRPTSVTLIKDSIRILDEEVPQISRFYDIIVDNPFQSETDEIQTLTTLNSLKRNFELTIFPLMFYPGTVLTREAVTKGMTADQGSLLTKGESCRYAKTYLAPMDTRAVSGWIIRNFMASPSSSNLDIRQYTFSLLFFI